MTDVEDDTVIAFVRSTILEEIPAIQVDAALAISTTPVNTLDDDPHLIGTRKRITISMFVDDVDNALGNKRTVAPVVARTFPEVNHTVFITCLSILFKLSYEFDEDTLIGDGLDSFSTFDAPDDTETDCTRIRTTITGCINPPERETGSIAGTIPGITISEDEEMIVAVFR